MPRAQRERQIVAVAESVFARRGFEGASMEEIARETGVDRALLYQYFGGKRELYESCVSTAVADLQERVTAALAGMRGGEDEATLREFGRKGIRVFFEFVRDHGDGWDVLFGAGWETDGESAATSKPPNMLGFVTSLIAVNYGRTAPRETLEAVASALIGASWAVSLWWRRHGRMSIDELTEHHLEFCLSTLEMLRRHESTGTGAPVGDAPVD